VMCVLDCAACVVSVFVRLCFFLALRENCVKKGFSWQCGC